MGRSGEYMCHSVSIWATQKVYGPLRKYMDHSGGKRGQAQGIWAIYGGKWATQRGYMGYSRDIGATQGYKGHLGVYGLLRGYIGHSGGYLDHLGGYMGHSEGIWATQRGYRGHLVGYMGCSWGI